MATLLNHLTLKVQAEIIYPFLLDCYHAYVNGKLNGCDLVGIFILSFLSIRKSKNWCNGKLKTKINEKENYSSSRLSRFPQLLHWLNVDYLIKNLKCNSDVINHSLTIVDIFNQLQFKGIKDNKTNYVNIGIVKWAEAILTMNEVAGITCYFELLFYIPNAIEVLQQQSTGRRVITMLFSTSNPELLAQKHYSKLSYMSGMQMHSRDALEFLLHDMKHMEHFQDPTTHQEQVGFFKCLYRLHNYQIQNYFSEECGLDTQFWLELEYVISDMYLYAKVYEAVKRKSKDDDVTALSSSSVDQVVIIIRDNPCNTTATSAMLTLWSKILQDLGMLGNLHQNGETTLTPIAVSTVPMIESEYGQQQHCHDLEAMVQCSYDAYHIAMDLISVTHRTRPEWDEKEGNIIRQFFKYQSY